MSEPVVYMLIGFFVGAIVGGAIVGRQRTKEFEDRIEELTEEKNELEAEQRRQHEAHVKSMEKHVEENGSKVDFVKLSRLYKSKEFDEHFSTRAHPEDDEPEDDEDSEGGEDYDILPDDPDNINLIEEDEYMRSLADRGSDSLVYYQEDGVLADSDGTPIRDQVDVIGVECMEEIEGTERDTLYVSNDIYDMVYLIHVEHTKSFYSDVMGV